MHNVGKKKVNPQRVFFLIYDYRKERNYWFLVESALRCATIAVEALFDTVVGLSLSCVILAFWMVLHYKAQPFTIEFLNYLQLAGTFAQLLLAMIIIFWVEQSGNFQENEGLAWVVIVLCYSFIVGLLVYGVYHLFYSNNSWMVENHENRKLHQSKRSRKLAEKKQSEVFAFHFSAVGAVEDVEGNVIVQGGEEDV